MDVYPEMTFKNTKRVKKMLDLNQDVVVLNTPKKGRGVFANRDFNVNEIVVVGKVIAKSPEQTWQTLQIDIRHLRKINKL